jgi:hypothetical protein
VGCLHHPEAIALLTLAIAAGTLCQKERIALLTCKLMLMSGDKRHNWMQTFPISSLIGSSGFSTHFPPQHQLLKKLIILKQRTKVSEVKILLSFFSIFSNPGFLLQLKPFELLKKSKICQTGIQF